MQRIRDPKIALCNLDEYRCRQFCNMVLIIVGGRPYSDSLLQRAIASAVASTTLPTATAAAIARGSSASSVRAGERPLREFGWTLFCEFLSKKRQMVIDPSHSRPSPARTRRRNDVRAEEDAHQHADQDRNGVDPELAIADSHRPLAFQLMLAILPGTKWRGSSDSSSSPRFFFSSSVGPPTQLKSEI